MSEQIREQVSAFLDGELHNSETELLLKRLTRDPELRESFGRYALIGEALREASPGILTRGFASRVNLAIDGEPVPASAPSATARTPRWWKPVGGIAVAAGVAAVAIIALQQRAVSPALVANAPNVQTVATALPVAVSREALSYTTPAAATGSATAMPPARLTNYVFAHSKYSSGLGRRSLLTDMLIEDDAPQAAPPSGGHAAP